MGLFSRLTGGGSSCGSCGLDDGEHARGCESAGGASFQRGNSAWQAAKQRARDGQRQAALAYVEKNKGNLYTTYTPAGPGNKRGLPAGVKMQETRYKGEKVYKIVFDEDGLDV